MDRADCWHVAPPNGMRFLRQIDEAALLFSTIISCTSLIRHESDGASLISDMLCSLCLLGNKLIDRSPMLMTSHHCLLDYSGGKKLMRLADGLQCIQ